MREVFRGDLSAVQLAAGVLEEAGIECQRRWEIAGGVQFSGNDAPFVAGRVAVLLVPSIAYDEARELLAHTSTIRSPTTLRSCPRSWHRTVAGARRSRSLSFCCSSVRLPSRSCGWFWRCSAKASRGADPPSGLSAPSYFALTTLQAGESRELLGVRYQELSEHKSSFAKLPPAS